MPKSPRSHCIGLSLTREDVRPNRKLCSSRHFALFWEALGHVLTKDKRHDSMPLHAVIRYHVEHFQTGNLSFNKLCECLRETAESTGNLVDDRLHRGKLTHVWKPAHQGTHKWLTDLVFHCHGMRYPPHRQDELDMDFHVVLNTPSRERPSFLRKWATYVMEEGATWLIEQGDPLPDVTITQGIHPGRTIIRVNHQALPDAWFQLAIHDDVNDAFTLELEWNTGNGQPMLDYAIHERISEAYRHDESVIGNDIDEPVVYTLDIRHAANAA